jgi:hypothetical protein
MGLRLNGAPARRCWPRRDVFKSKRLSREACLFEKITKVIVDRERVGRQTSLAAPIIDSQA